MKNICLILPNIKTGGGNRVFIELANSLVESGEYSVEILYPINSLDKSTFFVSPQLAVRSIGKFGESKLSKLWNLVLLMFFVYRERKEWKVIISDPFVSILFLFFPNRNLYRFIQADDYSIFDDGLILSSSFSRKLYKRLTLISYRKRIKFIFNSKFVYNQYLKYSRRSDVAYALVHPALNSTFRNLQVRRWDGLINICLVARKHPWKGFVDFIAAWHKIKDNVKDLVGKVYIISHDELDKFDIVDFVLIRPASDADICEVLNQSHLFVSTSWWEGFGLPPLEAMACGCACIISRSGGVLEYAVEGENSLMYTPKDVDALCAVMLSAIHDVPLLKQLGNAGEGTAKRFTWSHSTKQLLDVLN